MMSPEAVLSECEMWKQHPPFSHILWVKTDFKHAEVFFFKVPITILSFQPNCCSLATICVVACWGYANECVVGMLVKCQMWARRVGCTVQHLSELTNNCVQTCYFVPIMRFQHVRHKDVKRRKISKSIIIHKSRWYQQYAHSALVQTNTYSRDIWHKTPTHRDV